MYLDPAEFDTVPAKEILESAAAGHIGLDHRFIRTLLQRPEETIPAMVQYASQQHPDTPVDMEPDLVALIRALNAKEGIPFLIELARRDPHEIPDDVIETLVQLKETSLEPLLALYNKLPEEESGETAFILASLGIHDGRILQVLSGRLEYDASDTVFLMGLYGDPAVRPALETMLQSAEVKGTGLDREIEQALETLSEKTTVQGQEEAPERFDIYALYPEEADFPIDSLTHDERVELLSHPTASVRAAAVHSFFNAELETRDLTIRILAMARTDSDVRVRAKAWEALINATETPEVLEGMLGALRTSDIPLEEKAGVLIGLAPEADRQEVRSEMEALYAIPESRAKALEAMWRSVHPSFREHFAKHLTDADLETRRNAIWGVGYHGIRSELEKLRGLFDDEELRPDALFAYALAMPGETARGQIKGLFSRIEKEARGLSEAEEELVKAALDERLVLAGKPPFFHS